MKQITVEKTIKRSFEEAKDYYNFLRQIAEEYEVDIACALFVYLPGQLAEPELLDEQIYEIGQRYLFEYLDYWISENPEGEIEVEYEIGDYVEPQAITCKPGAIEKAVEEIEEHGYGWWSNDTYLEVV